MLGSSSPGILNGDELLIRVEVGSGSFLHLTTQSYQRLFNMHSGASQQMNINVGKGASFIFLPHPTVPHRRSSFTANNKIYLSKSSTLLWSEILTCGRKLSGEMFSFSKYQSITEIYVDHQLVLKENLLIQPALMKVSNIGNMEGFSHQATLIFMDEEVPMKQLMKELSDILACEEAQAFGITATQQNGLVIRLLGYKAEQIFDCFGVIANKIMEFIPAIQIPTLASK